jgi:hypothetical protein
VKDSLFVTHSAVTGFWVLREDLLLICRLESLVPVTLLCHGWRFGQFLVGYGRKTFLGYGMMWIWSLESDT